MTPPPLPIGKSYRKPTTARGGRQQGGDRSRHPRLPSSRRGTACTAPASCSIPRTASNHPDAGRCDRPPMPAPPRHGPRASRTAGASANTQREPVATLPNTRAGGQYRAAGLMPLPLPARAFHTCPSHHAPAHRTQGAYTGEALIQAWGDWFVEHKKKSPGRVETTGAGVATWVETRWDQLASNVAEVSMT